MIEILYYLVLVLGGVALLLMLRWMDRVEARLLELEEDAAFSSNQRGGE
ncbi:hypothetical protein QIH93_14865 [Bradyrhizobium ottawaense]|nr:hypothetical protein [Bradyrhizobium ottawaense]WLB49193.1 hypothetical protein QIH93_14865 [Bradyrhizobium ottawaense]